MVDVTLLESQIVEAATRYYSGQELIMTDAQFDDALERLRQVNPNHWILKSVGWGYQPSGNKLPHIGGNPVGSLEKVKYPETGERYARVCIGPAQMVLDEKKNIGINETCFVTPKLDGLSVVCYFSQSSSSGSNQLSFTAITRGDGVAGVDVSKKLKYIISKRTPDVWDAMQRNYRKLFSVRGEVIIPLEFEDEIKSLGFANTRNAAAGILNRKDLDAKLLDYLRFIPYFIRVDTSNRRYKNQADMVEEIWRLGFEKVETSKMTLPQPIHLKQAWERWKQIYPIDGLVLSPLHADIDLEEDYSEAETRAIAYKFEGEEREVVITRLDWSVGTQGQIVPTAVFEPVEIAGAMIGRASCHNFKNAEMMCLGAGAVIKVIRSNEVIPYITETVKGAQSLEYPAVCPECNQTTVVEAMHLKCNNTNCGPRARNAILRLIEVSGQVEGLAENTLTKFYDEYQIKSLGDMVHCAARLEEDSLESLQETFAPHFGKLLYTQLKNIQNKLEQGFSYKEFWYIQNLTGISEKMCQRLAELDPKTLEKSNFGDVLAPLKLPVNVIKSLKNNFDLWKGNLDPVVGIKVVDAVESTPKVESEYKVCITGKLSMPRAKLVKILQEKGVVVQDGVSKETTHLICDAPSSSSKYKKAVSLGTTIITEQEFMGLV